MVLPFTHERKMMSVVVRNKANNRIFVYSKGAPSVMLSRIKEGIKNPAKIIKNVK